MDGTPIHDEQKGAVTAADISKPDNAAREEAMRILNALEQQEKEQNNLRTPVYVGPKARKSTKDW